MSKSSIILLLFLVVQPHWGIGQDNVLSKAQLDTCKVYTSLEVALKNPEQVYILNISKSKLKNIPKEIGQLKNLNVLLASKNKLQNLPAEIAELKNLQVVDLGKNNISVFPDELLTCTSIRRLILNQNPIAALPHNIKEFTNLEYLDLWGTEMTLFPDSMKELKNLREIDLRVIGYNQTEKEHIISLMPGVKIHFSNTCNCGG